MTGWELVAAYVVGFLVSLYLLHRFAPPDLFDDIEAVFHAAMWPLLVPFGALCVLLSTINRGIRQLARRD